ncbi:MAG: hypothetical protein E6K81_01360 [Candidatus Eisenbacteria bacterium]|uniref:Endonuclease/exonuclease/phosphatase domain-containing protein n=1 Tax=Eiseniibacteriota bacterium TaxID=2212470 RepID=A0A538UDV9_UNCEI|nr:MAG: hypothetical protein E6K81_01360 [Candidatus Eisenbacteria bacterium]
MSTLRLATFNLLFARGERGPGSWPERRPLIRQVIERARPDVLGLQEALPSMLADLPELLGPLAAIVGPPTGPPRWVAASSAAEGLMHAIRTRRRPGPRSERGVSGEHLPIAYRADRLRPVASGGFWVSATPDHPGSMLPFAPTPFLVHWARFVALDGPEEMLVLNAHFGHAPWHHAATARVVTQKVAEWAGAGSQADAGGGPEVFLVGDFNAWPASPLVRGLTRPAPAGFIDAVSAAPERRGPKVTFHWGTGATRLGARLDHVLSRTPRRPRSAEVIDVHAGPRYPSDHHAVVVEFGPAGR